MTSSQYIGYITILICIIGMQDVYDSLFMFILIGCDKFKYLKSMGLLLPEYRRSEDDFIDYVLTSINIKGKNDWIFHRKVTTNYGGFERTIMIFHHQENFTISKSHISENFSTLAQGVEEIYDSNITLGSSFHKFMCSNFNPPGGSHAIITSRIKNLFKALGFYPYQIMQQGYGEIFMDIGCGDPRVGLTASLMNGGLDVFLIDIGQIILLLLQNFSIKCQYDLMFENHPFVLQESRFFSERNVYQV